MRNLSVSEETVMHLDNQEAALLYGAEDENLRFLEQRLPVSLLARGGEIHLVGNQDEVKLAQEVFQRLRDLVRQGNAVTVTDANNCLNAVMGGVGQDLSDALNEVLQVTVRGRYIKPKTVGQYRYIQAIRSQDVVFGIGPAGTGKTYLAVVMAVSALKNKDVSRIVLTRPAVEAGEKLGFLPGDLQDKVDPYLRPLYDALYDLLSIETAQRYVEKRVIEIAPLAYMRGRTLDDAFIILDEAQNTTPEQMKMFLTRIGFNSKTVVTGDITQVDLTQPKNSGLMVVQKILKGIPGVSFQYLSQADIVRHPVVQRIIAAYEAYQALSEKES